MKAGYPGESKTTNESPRIMSLEDTMHPANYSGLAPYTSRYRPVLTCLRSLIPIPFRGSPHRKPISCADAPLCDAWRAAMKHAYRNPGRSEVDLLQLGVALGKVAGNQSLSK